MLTIENFYINILLSFININSYSSCDINISSISSNYLNFDNINNILNKKYISPIEFKSIICLFKNILLNTNNNKNDEFVKKWIDSYKPFKDVESAYGDIYNVNMFNNNFILKTYKIDKDVKLNSKKFYDFLKEYYIGMYCLNNLKYYVPTFVNTIGYFKCSNNSQYNTSICINNKDKPFIILEKIKGDTAYNFLKNIKNIDNLISFILQTMFALEIAQREYQFTHFDLHLNNIMVEELSNNNKLNYSVVLYDKIYEFNTNIKVTIIDYGMSTCKKNNKIYGNIDDTKINRGITQTLIPGFDVITFIRNIIEMKDSIFNNIVDKSYILNMFQYILDLFNSDPNNKKLICSSIDDIFNDNKITYNKSYQKYTPFMLIRHILNNKNLFNTDSFLTVHNRDDISYNFKYLYSNNYIYNKSIVNIDDLLKTNVDCIKSTLNNEGISFYSYITYSYIINILKQFTENNTYNNLINELTDEQNKYKNKLIEIDIKIFNKYEKLKFTNEDIERMKKFLINKNITKEGLNQNLKQLNANINNKNETYTIMKHETLREGPHDDFFYVSIYNDIKKLEKYVNLYYNMIELRLSDIEEYKNMIKNFKNSSQYLFYIKNIELINQYQRFYDAYESYINYIKYVDTYNN